jgi:predicted ATP-dependent endonuclease of OLD family
MKKLFLILLFSFSLFAEFDYLDRKKIDLREDNEYFLYEFEMILDTNNKYGNNAYFKINGQIYEYPIGITSEGVKKISIIDTLLGNRYLSKGSTIFIDEPESNLHPKLLFEFLDIIYELSQMGIQFFIATHSYFVVKKLYIIAQKNKKSIPIISFEKDKINISNLKQGLPENPIINESINLYKEEIDI